MSNELTNITAIQIFERAKITPYRVQHLVGGGVLYEFWRAASEKSLRDRKAKKELALISVSSDKKTFNLHYHPLDKENQIILENLSIETELQKAVEDLKSAGFR